MKRILFFRTFAVFLLLAACLATAQQRRMGRYQITVTPDHSNWIYATGENVTFTIHVQSGETTATGAELTWTLGPDNMPPFQTQKVALTGADIRVDGGTLRQPGFLRLTASVQESGGGFPSRGMATAAFAPEQIKAVAEEPEGFDKFWEEGKARLAKIPIAPQRTPYAGKTTETLNAFEVSFQVPSGDLLGRSRIYGILTEPKAPGKYPAVLRVPGAGVYNASGIVKDNYENAITLSIGIHGIPLTLDNSVYNALSQGALSSYNRSNLDSKDRYYYRRVYLGCIRAVDYLASLENWDGKTIIVTGNSQGGALSIVTAALDPRIKGLAIFHQALSDITGYLSGRAGGWPDVFKGPENRTKDNLETAAYYDVVNFARRLKVPGIYTWGLNDETCPPTSTYASFNAVAAPKTLYLAKETGHFMSEPQVKRINEWINAFIKTGKAPVE
jgi:cephalosporin-C deacetylase-like acetyl esterase